MNERQIGYLKDIAWYIKGLNAGDTSPFNSEHSDSLLEAILIVQRLFNDGNKPKDYEFEV